MDRQFKIFSSKQMPNIVGTWSVLQMGSGDLTAFDGGDERSHQEIEPAEKAFEGGAEYAVGYSAQRSEVEQVRHATKIV